jgi:hypothetical protein
VFADRLLVCLCAYLADTIAGPVCQCSVRPGSPLPPADVCCDCTVGQGQASIQVGPIYPMVAGKFPSRGVSGQLTNCSSFEWAAELTLVVYRCVSVADEDGFPSVNELTVDAAKIASDADAMWQAVFCCPGWRDIGDPDGELALIAPGEWRPAEPMGGCAGGQLSVIVNLGSICCPPPAG